MEKDIEYYQAKLKIAQELRNKQEEMAVLADICRRLSEAGKSKDAIDYCRKSLKLAQELGDRKQEQTMYRNLGFDYQNIAEYDTAREFLMESLEIARELGDKNEEMIVLTIIGCCLQNQGKGKDAIDYSRKSLKLAQEFGNRIQEQIMYRDLGLHYRDIEEYETATECFMESLKIARELGDKKHERTIYKDLEWMCEKTGQVELSLKYYTEALKIETELSANGIPEVIGDKRNITEDEHTSTTETSLATSTGVDVITTNRQSLIRASSNTPDGGSAGMPSSAPDRQSLRHASPNRPDERIAEIPSSAPGKRARATRENDGEIHHSSSHSESKKALIAQYLGHEIYSQLCQKLESQMNKDDFKRFGEEMGYSMKQVNNFKQKKDPANALLSDWQNKNENDLGKLMSIYEEMGLHNVVAMLQNAIDDESQGYGNVIQEEKADTTENNMKEDETGQASAEDNTPPPDIQPMEMKDINPTKIEWSKATKDPIDVLLVAVNDMEFRAAYQILSEPKSADSGGAFGMVYFGQIGENKVSLVRSSTGADGNIGMIATCLDGIHKLHAETIINAGVCFGMKKSKQKLGDVVVSTKLACYESSRVNPDNSYEFRGTVSECKPRITRLFRDGKVGWNSPSKNGVVPDVHCGLMISGSKLVDCKDFKEKLQNHYRDAEGGEMEGAGLHLICERYQRPWIVCKAISDWGDGTKNKEWQPYAAVVAASYVKHVLEKSYVPEKEVIVS